MWCWIVSHADTVRNGLLFFGLIGGGIGLYFAWWRCKTADQNLLRERCQMGMELLSLNPERYIARVAGATILSDILDSPATEYDHSILRAFEAFLAYPPRFGGDGETHKNPTDYESRDTIIVMIALRRYAKKPFAQPMRSLHEDSIFIITRNTVKPNEEHRFYKLWIEKKGRPPNYSE